MAVEEDEDGSEKAVVQYVNFNQDAGCFAYSTSVGFRIYSCDPLKQTLRRDLDGGVGIVEMVFRSNILGLVGAAARNKVIIWDDDQSRCIGELFFRSEVRAVRLRRDAVVAVLEHKVHVHSLSDLKPLHEVETFDNPRGVCAISPASTMFVLACPGTMSGGEVRLELYSLGKTLFVQAHESPLACLALSQDGRLLATASVKGTIVRIFDTNDGTKLHEFRRGAERAEIFSLALSVNCHWLAVSSDKCTVHVFNLVRSKFEHKPRRRLPRLSASSIFSLAANSSMVQGVLPSYLKSDWSFAQFRLPADSRAIVAFGAAKNTVIIICGDGSYYRCAYDADRGGDMVQKEFAKFT
ncbi:hypothetical protein SELMODRAFT_138072 [Selaginella moellendorffii]|uniref:Anaphase-promoting complex subunit 4 WD40 domain-containing protein n=1 Tax=Selaginella moellendorffii TaxID=88036 RepID=D8TEK7_SELML|nr:autophagy-related protein 18a [Selaginella moellendorffii]EFJ04904.1 hypothetical protein SELMODRAFT_138072 [Selaginella moellendorffii]|eukprot:XP_002994022.1 autophagy-related protein 18a [Selaginella moellendorffii]